MNKKIITVLKWAAAAFAVFFIVSQVYSSLINPVTTDTVYKYFSYSGYSVSGYIIRNETVVESSISGALSYEVEDGGRVSKNGTIATVYSSESDAERQAKIEQLDSQIASLEELQTYNDLNATDVNTINIKIRSFMSRVADETQDGAVTRSDSYDSFLSAINRKQIVTGQISDFNALISSLRAERDGLAASVPSPLGTLKAPVSGYVIYSVDGYETAVSTEDIAGLTAESLQAIKLSDTQTVGAVCKIVGDYEWYIAAEIPFSESLNLKAGEKVKLKTQLLSSPELTATVKHINKQSVGENAVAVFACNTMNTELAGTRNLDITIVYDEYEGLRVDNRAIRLVDGVKGVYVLTASQVKFVAVNIIWTGDKYSIAELQASDSKVLRIYDEIIVKGKNLYDGKIIS